jgi:Flp pilus assembly secretin CpaC
MTHRLHRLLRHAQHHCHVASLVGLMIGLARVVSAQPAAAPRVERVVLQRGHSAPVTTPTTIANITVANPDVATAVVLGSTSVVVSASAPGETDIILWSETGVALRHLRIAVQDAVQTEQVLLGVKFAEVRTSSLRQIAGALRYRGPDGGLQGGFGALRSDNAGDGDDALALNPARFLGVVSTFNSRELLGMLDAEVQLGNARLLAEPTLTAAMGEEASFLAGGEIPIPIVQGGGAGQQGFVTIQFREFGVRLTFRGLRVTDSLLRLYVKPEVSSLDYGNSVTLQGFQIPALRTRRVESTVDVLSDRSLVISGLFNEEREQVRTGVPLLSRLPLLGSLFSSRRWIENESELVVIVTPMLLDSERPRGAALPERNEQGALPDSLRSRPRRPPGL